MQLVTPPTLSIVTVPEMKDHLRVIGTDEDALIADLIRGAVAHLDGWKGLLGWCLGAQTWRFGLDRFPAGVIRMPVGPLIEVVSIEHANPGEAYATLDPAEYIVDTMAAPGCVSPLDTWPDVSGPNAVRITFRAGYNTDAEISDSVKVAIKMIVGHWYANREAVGASMSNVPMSANAIVSAVRLNKI